MSWNRFEWERAYFKNPMPLGPHAVLWALVYHADKDGWCHPSSELLAFEAASSTPRAVRNWMAELEEVGWVKVERGTGRGNPSKYRLLIPPKGESRSPFTQTQALASDPLPSTKEEPRSPFTDPKEEHCSPFMNLKEEPRSPFVSPSEEQCSRKGEHYSLPPTPPLEEEQSKNNPGNIASCNARDPKPQQDGSWRSLGGGEPPLPPNCLQEPPRASEEAQPSDPAHSAGSRPASKVNGAVVGEDQRPKPDPAPTSPPPSDPAPSQDHAPAHKPSNHERLSALMGMFGHKKPSDAPLGPPTLPKPASVPGPSARPPKHTRKHHNPKPTTR